MNLSLKILSIVFLLVLSVIIAAVAEQEKSVAVADDLMPKAQNLFKPIPKTVVLEGVEITAEKIELGKMLWFDPRLSKSGVISCNTCHNVGLAGADLQKTSIGHGWQQGPRNAPTVFNAAFHIDQFWDGRAADLFEQAQGPVQAGVEMNSTPNRVIEILSSMPEYEESFNEVFPEEGITFENMARAIEAFETILITPNSRFDMYLQGDEQALNLPAKIGLQLFIDKGCVSCHNGVAVGGNSYQRFGAINDPSDTVRPPEDIGRAKVTENQVDEYVFKVPSLRNIVQTGPYFHSGEVATLDEAVRVMADTQLGINLTDYEVDKIVRFLGTLTGEKPIIGYPKLPASTANTPIPNTAAP